MDKFEIKSRNFTIKSRLNFAFLKLPLGLSLLLAYSIFCDCLDYLPAAFAQTHGAIDSPPLKPAVDQIGELAVLGTPEKVSLAVYLFLLMMSCVGVAIAMAAHLSHPPKSPKARG